MQSDRITVFEASLCRLNVVVQVFQNLTHINFPIGEGPKSSYMSGLTDAGYRLNLRNFE